MEFGFQVSEVEDANCFVGGTGGDEGLGERVECYGVDCVAVLVFGCDGGAGRVFCTGVNDL